jgi:hypothetical protein
MDIRKQNVFLKKLLVIFSALLFVLAIVVTILSIFINNTFEGDKPIIKTKICQSKSCITACNSNILWDFFSKSIYMKFLI